MDKVAIELSKLPFIETINDLKNEIDGFRPISKEIEDKVFQKLKLDWNYNSNAIEGNKLNYGETVAFLMHGITAKGKTLKDHLDIKGHNEAINFLLSLVREERDISESDIRALHKMILVEEYDSDAITQDGKSTTKRIKLGTYKTSANSVKTRTGEIHHYASVEETPLLMADLMNWYNENKTNNEIHPLVLASLFHFKFVAIHPFDDGNGRLARILMNLILMRNQFPPIVVKNEDKDNYYGVLAQADSNQVIPLIEYMSDLLQHSLTLYLKGIKGESIEEESDIDKEIALFKKSFNVEDTVKIVKNTNDLNKVLNLSIMPLFKKLSEKLKKIDDLFLKSKISVIIHFENSKNIVIDLSDFLLLIAASEIENTFKNKIIEIQYRYEWVGFKKSEKNFNHTFDFRVYFYELKYVISKRFGGNSLSKYYHQYYTDEDINLIITLYVKYAIESIDKLNKKN